MDLGLGVVGSDGDRALQDDRTMVGLLVDEMDGRARDLDAVRLRRALRVESLEGRQQPRVDVHDP